MEPWRVTSPFRAARPRGVAGLRNEGRAAATTGSLGWMWPASAECAAALWRISMACSIEMPTLEPRLRAMVLTMVPSTRWAGESVA